MVFQGEGAPSTGTGHGGWERKVTFIEPELEAGALSPDPPYAVFPRNVSTRVGLTPPIIQMRRLPQRISIGAASSLWLYCLSTPDT